MKRKMALILTRLLLVALLLAWGGAALAQSGGGYSLAWYTIDCGGGSSSAGDGYRLDGTIGQSDAGAAQGGGYVLAGGFWPDPHVTGGHIVHIPFLLRK